MILNLSHWPDKGFWVRTIMLGTNLTDGVRSHLLSITLKHQKTHEYCEHMNMNTWIHCYEGRELKIADYMVQVSMSGSLSSRESEGLNHARLTTTTKIVVNVWREPFDLAKPSGNPNLLKYMYILNSVDSKL